MKRQVTVEICRVTSSGPHTMGIKPICRRSSSACRIVLMCIADAPRFVGGRVIVDEYLEAKQQTHELARVRREESSNYRYSAGRFGAAAWLVGATSAVVGDYPHSCLARSPDDGSPLIQISLDRLSAPRIEFLRDRREVKLVERLCGR